MFAGIIGSKGKILKIGVSRATGKKNSLLVQTPFKSVLKGESVAIDGICLTVTEKRMKKSGAVCAFEFAEETLKKTTAEKMCAGMEVNLERSLRMNDRISGHFVQGHIDGTGQILNIQPQENSKQFSFSYPSFLQSFIVPKGSIAVNGVSLTVVDVSSESFSVTLLPFTEKNTSFHDKKTGDFINLEADILAKTLAKQFQLYLNQQRSLEPLFQKKEVEWNQLMIEEGYQ